ncbi:hypothetical protein, conserved [Eimeria praecox]|uniref:Transmembrane protein n=1 Tax=Eimeria praecox TaxID=51316 RepID=U6GM48_9EIME|nr:hypothetical protein, conserved [Eimeria praecox]
MAFGASRTALCGEGHTQRFKILNLNMRLLFVALLIFVPMNVINTEGFLGVSAEPRAAPDVLAAEAVETEAAAEPQSPEAPRDQVRAESAPVDDGSRERSSLAAVYNASTAHPSVSQQPQGIQDGITKRRAQLAAVAILLSIGFFLLMAKVRLYPCLSDHEHNSANTFLPV